MVLLEAQTVRTAEVEIENLYGNVKNVIVEFDQTDDEYMDGHLFEHGGIQVKKVFTSSGVDVFNKLSNDYVNNNIIPAVEEYIKEFENLAV